MSNVIEVKNVTMRFGGVTAVNDLNMAIPKEIGRASCRERV